jgi:2-polyprenyl-6-methoxyphenol hydroxylase-like FAD-dependent oxidoreductase
VTRVAIIGGGIGGATAGCALAQAGFEVSVYEAAPELKEIGAGVALHPNAMRVLRMIGVQDAVRRVAGRSEWSTTHNWRTGRVISKISRAQQAATFGLSGATVHRVRAALFGPDDPRFTGKICYRSVIPIDAVAGERPATDNAQWLGPHGTVVLYPVRAEELINVVCHYDDEHHRHEQAVEDGAVLATALSAEPHDLSVGLARYERTRRPRASRVVLAARERGASNHLSSPLTAWRRDITIALRRRFGKDTEGRGAAWIPEYDATSPDVLAS